MPAESIKEGASPKRMMPPLKIVTSPTHKISPNVSCVWEVSPPGNYQVVDQNTTAPVLVTTSSSAPKPSFSHRIIKSAKVEPLVEPVESCIWDDSSSAQGACGVSVVHPSPQRHSRNDSKIKVLQRRASTVKSIGEEEGDWANVISHSFVPNILRKIIAKSWVEGDVSLIPTSLFVKGFCLLVDISGFTKLSARYCEAGKDGIDDLQQATNGFMADIVDIVYLYGGDIIKYAGDAIICIFPVNSAPNKTGGGLGEKELSIALRSIQCANKLKSMVSPDGLTVHVGLSAGDICCAMMGGSHDRWECLVSGSCLMELSQCLDDAPSGNAALSSSVVAFIGQEMVDEFATTTPASSGKTLLLRKVKKEADYNSLVTLSLDEYDANDGVDDIADESVQPLLLQFCPTPVLSGLRNADIDNVAEIRKVTVVFLKFDSYDMERHRNLLSLQPHLLACQDVIHEAGGFIRQFIVDDKGCVLIACWGVPTASFIDNSARALSSSVGIHKALNKLGMECSFGITTGNAYCGCVGSERRREYAAIGDIVNLAARLMCKAKGGIVVDQATHDAIPDMSLQLSALEPMKVKGKDEPIQAYGYEFEGSVLQAGLKAETMAKIMLSSEQLRELRSALTIDTGSSKHLKFNNVPKKKNSIAPTLAPTLHYMLVTGRESANKVLVEYMSAVLLSDSPAKVVHFLIQPRDAYFQLKPIARLFSIMASEFALLTDQGNLNLAINRVIVSTVGKVTRARAFCAFLVNSVLGIPFISPMPANPSDTIDSVAPSKIFRYISKLLTYMLKAKRWLVCIENIDLADPLSLFYIYTLKDIQCTSILVMTASVDGDREVADTVAPCSLVDDMGALQAWYKYRNAYRYFLKEEPTINTLLADDDEDDEDDDRSSENKSLSSGSNSESSSRSCSTRTADTSINSSVNEITARSKKEWETKYISAFAKQSGTVHLVVPDMSKAVVQKLVQTHFPEVDAAAQLIFADTAVQITNSNPYWMAELFSFVRKVGMDHFMTTLQIVEMSSNFTAASPTANGRGSAVKDASTNNDDSSNNNNTSSSSCGVKSPRARPITLQSLRTREIQGSEVAGGSGSILEAFVVCRYEALSDIAKVMVRVIAVIGNRFTLDLAEAILPQRASTKFKETLDELVSNNWIVDLSDQFEGRDRAASAENYGFSASSTTGPTTTTTTNTTTSKSPLYGFQHPLFQQVLFNFTPVSERMDLHSKIAEILAKGNESSFEHYANIFQHLKSAERRSDALHYAVLAGQMALDSNYAEVGVDYCLEVVRKSSKLCGSTAEVTRLIILVREARLSIPRLMTVSKNSSMFALSSRSSSTSKKTGKTGERDANNTSHDNDKNSDAGSDHSDDEGLADIHSTVTSFTEAASFNDNHPTPTDIDEYSLASDNAFYERDNETNDKAIMTRKHIRFLFDEKNKVSATVAPEPVDLQTQQLPSQQIQTQTERQPVLSTNGGVKPVKNQGFWLNLVSCIFTLPALCGGSRNAISEIVLSDAECAMLTDDSPEELKNACIGRRIAMCNSYQEDAVVLLQKQCTATLLELQELRQFFEAEEERAREEAQIENLLF